MVQYWKTKDSVAAKVTKSESGSLIKILEGEKYPFPTFPRGHLLFGPLSKLKHEIKNQIFNESWAMLESGNDKEVVNHIKTRLFNEIAILAEKTRYDRLPIDKMCPSVKEIHRAWSKVEEKFTGEKRKNLENLKEYLCFILQEDDAYRFRVQWLVTWFGFIRFFNPIKAFEKALIMLEHAEVIGDMKERIRLLRRILLTVLKDETIGKLFTEFFKEVDWKKVALTKADKFHFRGKYFKVDLDLFEY